MRIAVVGPGGVGGYYGALLAKSGEDVWFIGRGDHLRAIREKGLRVKSTTGEFTLRVKATDTPSDVGPVDLVLLCVKTYDTENALKKVRPLIGDRTVILSLQNGVDNAERIGAAVGMKRILGGLTHIESEVSEPGVIHQRSVVRRVTVGELDGARTERAERIVEAFERTGVDCFLSSNIKKSLWEKFLFICAVGGVTSVTRSTIGEVLDFPNTRQMLVAAMREVEAVARAASVPLDADAVDKAVALASSFPRTTRSSMQKDVERGKPLEVDTLNGTVVALGRKLGVSTPVNGFIHACLKVQDERNRERKVSG